MSQSNFDELNIVASERVYRSKDKEPQLSIEEYFGEMELPEEAKQKRIGIAYVILGTLIYLFTMIKAAQMAKEEFDISYYKKHLASEIKNACREVLETDEYDERAKAFADQIIDTTFNHIETEYFTSEDRALVDAENEANSIVTDFEFQEAIRSGKTKKQWITMHDFRVRHTHRAVDMTVIPIMEYFNVGDSSMLYPMDIEHGSLKEIVGCRCVCNYF